MKKLFTTFTFLLTIATVFAQQNPSPDTVPGMSLSVNGRSAVDLDDPDFVEHLGIGTFTVTAWIKMKEKNMRQHILACGDRLQTGGALWFYINADNKLAAEVTGAATPVVSDVAINDSNWHHVALVVGNQGGYYLYIDGNRTGAMVMMGLGIKRGGPHSAAIGRSMISDVGNAHGFSGEIDELKIVSDARDLFHLRQDINRPSHVTEGILAYYQFNTPGDTVYDSFRYDARNQFNNGLLVDGAALKPSTVPLGSKSSAIISRNDSADFSVAYMNVSYTHHDPFDNEIDLFFSNPLFQPNIIPPGTDAYKGGYWISRQYGDPGVFEGSITFFIPTAELDKNDTRLYWRPSNSDSAWTCIDTANSNDVTDTSVLFNGIRQWGQFMVASGNSTTGLADAEANARNWSMYPNPAADVLHIINKKETGIANISIYTLTGQLVEQRGLALNGESAASLPIEHVTAGMYLVQVTDRDGASYWLRLVKK